MLTLQSFKKAKSFGLTEIGGKPIEEGARDIVALAFVDGGGDRLAMASLDNEPFVASVHLRQLFPNLHTSSGTYDYNAAWDAFCKEFLIGSEQKAFNGYEFAIRDLCEFNAVKVIATGRVMRTRRIASPKSRENAMEIAKRDIQRGLGKRYEGVEE
jgi:hypothetical protein